MSLKPCPFCGTTPRLIYKNPSDNTEYMKMFCIKCPSCDSKSAEYKDEIYAIAAWNVRKEITLKQVQEYCKNEKCKNCTFFDYCYDCYDCCFTRENPAHWDLEYITSKIKEVEDARE